MNQPRMNARTLRIVLLITMLLILVASAVGFYFAQKQLKQYAESISALNADARASDNNVQLYQSISNVLTQNAGTVDKANEIVAQSREYQYQDQIVEDLTAIGRASSVKIRSFTFSDTTVTATNGSSPAATTPTMPTQNISGLTSRKVDISIDSPLGYNDILSFIKRIEQNKLKMQIAGISLSKSDSNDVTSESFTIEVYVR